MDATQVLMRDRDALRQRVAELEAANQRLVDMLWGRRSERRTESPDQRHLNFGDEPPTPEQQAVITAQAEADEAFDQELLRRLAARRKARRRSGAGSQEFPPHLERRERTIDLPEEEKAGLKLLRIDITGAAAVREAARLRGADSSGLVRGGGPARERRPGGSAAAGDRRGLQVRLQRHRGDHRA